MSEQGICPSCEGLGAVGERCPTSVCARRTYHYVPGEYVSLGALEPPDALIGRRIGDYLVVKLQGVGGFGRVYLTLQFPIRMKAALKLLNTDGLPEALVPNLREKFEGEARALALLQHPNIVRLLHYGLLYGRPYLVMEFLENGVVLATDIEERASRGERYDGPEIWTLFSQLLDGLGAAHALDIVHRDIKPDNIMVQAVHGNPRLVRILDFGLAKVVTTGGTTRNTVGTPNYMAPEQLENKHIGPWSDLYAVGVMLFELLTGRPPYPGNTMQEVFARKVDPGFDPVAAIEGRGYPLSTHRFLRRALARQHTVRFQSAAEMQAALHECLEQLADAEARPLQKVRLSGLLDPEESGDVPSTHILGSEPASPAPPRSRSDNAFRHWLEQEADRLDKQEADLAQKRGRRRSRDTTGD